MNHQQKNWSEWLTTAEFAVNNKAHSATKVSLFIVNYSRELRMGADIRKKEKVEKVIELSQNELLTCLWYLNLGCTLRGLEMIQKFNNNDNDN